MKTRALIFTLSILLAIAARAELKFEQTQIELHPAVGDKEAVGHFKYQNTSDKPVRIKSVRSSCGCTAAQTQKDEIAPGDKGEVTATFKIGDRTGTQIKSVTVETDDPMHATTALVLKAVIPQMLEIQPAFAYWQSGEAPNPKTITVKTGKDFPVKELKLTPSNQDFQAKVQKVGNSEFKIDIRPHDTARASSATITIQPDNSPKKFYVSARVMSSSPRATTSVQQ
jgi:uncharacterized protein DUF1573